MKDYRVEIRVKNNWLLQKMQACGFDTAISFAKACGLQQSYIGEFLNLKKSAKNAWGDWRSPVLTMAAVLKCLPEDLFPPQHVTSALARNKSQFEMSADEVHHLTSSLSTIALPPDVMMERKQAVGALMAEVAKLPPREKHVIERRFGLVDGNIATFEEIAAELGHLSRTRIAQLEAKALRTMKKRADCDGKHTLKAAEDTLAAA